MIRKFLGLLIVASLPISLATADLSSYSQNFESMTPAADIPNIGDPGSSDLADDGWLVTGNVFEGAPGGGGAYAYGYGGVFPAPNYSTNAGFSGVEADQGTGGQGIRHLNIYSDYANGEIHPPTGSASRYVDALVFQEQTIGAIDLGTIALLDFQYKGNADLDPNNVPYAPNGNTRTFAFVKVLENGGSFQTLGFDEVETTSASIDDWADGSLSLLIDGAWEGQLLQFGFRSEAQDSNNSGILYDNLNFSQVPEPGSFALLGLLGIGLVARRRRR